MGAQAEAGQVVTAGDAMPMVITTDPVRYVVDLLLVQQRVTGPDWYRSNRCHGRLSDYALMDSLGKAAAALLDEYSQEALWLLADLEWERRMRGVAGQPDLPPDWLHLFHQKKKAYEDAEAARAAAGLEAARARAEARREAKRRAEIERLLTMGREERPDA